MKKLSIIIGLIAVLAILTNSSNGQNSILAEGSWYKLAVQQTGIYKINYDDLVAYGIIPLQINPKNIRIYGNGNGMLPEANDAFRYDDLQENAIFVNGENDEVFDPGDYILFYGEGPTEWKLNEATGYFDHQVNYYSDYTYYFITIGTEEGKRIVNQAEPSGNPTQTIQMFNDYLEHEGESYNLIQSGKSWYGELFLETTDYNFDLNFPDLLTDFPVHLKSSFANRSFVNCSMEISIDGDTVSSVVLTSVNPSSTKYAQKKTDAVSFYVNNPAFNLNFSYNQPNDSAMAWLDYFELNFMNDLNLNGNQLSFRSIASVGVGEISMFEISNADASTWAWNVTDPINISGIAGIVTGDQFEFKIATDSLLDFIAFKGMEFESPEFIGQLGNQNLHGIDPMDYIIITYPDFLAPAQQLAAFHGSNDGLSSFVVTPEIIYNEFSSGSPDVTAIRDFIKYLYDKSEGEKPEYLLLFGDGSYDPKDRIENNTNFIPTFQTKESLITAASYVIEDYFGYMDASEGYDGIGDSDIGVGRLPVKSFDEASNSVSKIIYYSTNNNTFGNWKNDVCLIADDADGNLHLEQADSIAQMMTGYNVDKLYFDFYERVLNPEGPRYPEVEEKISQKMEEGVFLMNYIGHGGDTVWGQEHVLENSDIENWNNADNMPVMVIASCEFSRFDNPDLTSGGELAVLKNNGGVIGMLSSSRLAYAQSNFAVNQRLTEYFIDPDIETKRLGDLARYSKPPGQLTTRNFILLGDPALKISIPTFKVVTETINGINVSLPLDSIQPGEQITVTGFIADFDGNLLNNFNGNILITVFERPYIKTTLGNQPYSYPVDIIVQDSVMMELQAEVINGQFEYSFTLPSNLSQSYGKIKLSHYSFNQDQDASGFFSEIVVGGQPNIIYEQTTETEVISIYPTIVNDYLNYSIQQDIQNLVIEVFDITGKKSISYSSSNNLKGERSQMNLSELSDGFYIIHAIADDHQINLKIIKK
jgi:hypothetical protein